MPDKKVAGPPAKKSRGNPTTKKRDDLPRQPPQPRPCDAVLACGSGDMGQLPTLKESDKKFRRVDWGNSGPESLEEGPQFVSGTASGLHTLLLLSNGRVLSNGVNDEGALGRATPDEDDSVKPGFVVGLPEEEEHRAIALAAGDSYGAVLTAHGQVWAWGTFRGHSGRVGIASSTNRRNPIISMSVDPLLIYDPPTHGRKAVSLCGGANHLAFLTNTGEMFTAGVGVCGQLSRVSLRSMTSFHESDTRLAKIMLKPDLVQLGKEVKRVLKIWATAYCTFALCLRKDGTTALYGCGLNNHSQLGVDGEGDDEPTEVPFLVPLTKLNALGLDPSGWGSFAGYHHTLACHSGSGRVYGMGRSEDCRLGKEDENEKVALPRLILDKAAISVAAGPVSCFALIKKQGEEKVNKVLAWGLNNNGELGLGLEDSETSEPTQVASKHLNGPDGDWEVQLISAAEQHSLLLATKSD